MRHDQTLCWAKQYIIDQKFSFWLWRQTARSSVNYTTALFVGAIEQVVNLNVTWLDFVFILISFVHIHDIIWRGGFIWNWTPKVKGMEQYRTWIDRGGGRSWKLDNFHGCHLCISPQTLFTHHTTKVCSYML